MHYSHHPCCPRDIAPQPPHPAPCPCACPGGTFPYTVRQGDTFYLLAQEYGVSVQSIIDANPGVDPMNLRIGQTICIPACAGGCESGCPGGGCTCEDNLMAAQLNIAMLRAQSQEQASSDGIYGNSTQTTRVTALTGTQISFAAAPVTFSGNYLCQFTLNEGYAYYEDAAIGGQRSLYVRDNFGIWHAFHYRVPI